MLYIFELFLLGTLYIVEMLLDDDDKVRFKQWGYASLVRIVDS